MNRVQIGEENNKGIRCLRLHTYNHFCLFVDINHGVRACSLVHSLQWNSVGYSPQVGPMRMVQLLLYHWQGWKALPRQSRLRKIAFQLSTPLYENQQSIPRDFWPNKILASTTSMWSFMSCKILVLIIGSIIYEAHIEWMCGTYNEIAPL